MSLELVKEYLTEYAMYVNETRSTPSLDGFKAVQRRIFYTTYKIAKDKFVKTATVAGNVVAYYHPHGTASVEDAMIGMVRNNWIEGQGNWGSRTGLEEIKAAASRYTEVKFNEKLLWTMDLIKYADFTKSEIDYDEPAIIPTPIPIGLIGDLVNFPQPQQGIGIGIRVLIPMYKLSDLVSVIKSLAKEEKPNAPIPFVGKYYDVIEHESDRIFKTGVGRIKIRPQYTLEDKKLILHACSKNLLKLIQPWKDKLSVKDLSKPDVTHIIIEPKKYVRIDFESFVKELLKKLEDTITFNTYVSVPLLNEPLVARLSIEKWLKIQFSYYIKVKQRYINDMIHKLSDSLAEARLIKELRPYIIDYLKSTTKPTPDGFLQYLPDKFDKAIINTLIKKYSISKLLSIDIDEEDIIKQLNSWKKIEDRIVDDALHELEMVLEDR